MKPSPYTTRTRILTLVTLASAGLIPSVASADTVNAIYDSADDVPVAASSYTATGNTVDFTLNFAPSTGTDLMVVNNTGLDFIHGTFDNLTNGQAVTLSYAGTVYSFVANYYGGSGNDLVLTWAQKRLVAWGTDEFGQLGDNASGTNRLAPVAVYATGVLAGKTVVEVAAGAAHSLALCSDGTLAAWGSNGWGQLGNSTTNDSHVPVAVDTTSGVSALYGKTVVALGAGYRHSLALCSDGTVAAWGDNSYGQLGDNTTNSTPVPVAVNTDLGVSALSGKTVVAIVAGKYHSLALCSDGTVASWGENNIGQLGDNSQATRLAPVAVNTTPGLSALSNKTVVAIAAGMWHSLALCSDGSVAGWGNPGHGETGNSLGVGYPLAPFPVNTASGVSALYGETVVAIRAGYQHNLALCSDGTLTASGCQRLRPSGLWRYDIYLLGSSGCEHECQRLRALW